MKLFIQATVLSRNKPVGRLPTELKVFRYVVLQSTTLVFVARHISKIIEALKDVRIVRLNSFSSAEHKKPRVS